MQDHTFDELRRRNEEMEREEIANQTEVWASGENPHKHRGGRQKPKDLAKKKKAKRRQQKQSKKMSRK